MIVEKHWRQYPGYWDSTFQFGTRYEQDNKQLPESEFIFEFSYYGYRSFDNFNEIWTSLIMGNIKFVFQPGTESIALEQYSEDTHVWEDTSIRFHGTPEEFINNHVYHRKDDLLWWYRKCFHKFIETVPSRIKELQDLM